MSTRNQFFLLGERRFAPYFWTQFLGASNDNLFKFAFTMLAGMAWGLARQVRATSRDADPPSGDAGAPGTRGGA